MVGSTTEWRKLCELVRSAPKPSDRTEEERNRLLALISQETPLKALHFDARQAIASSLSYHKEAKAGAELVRASELQAPVCPWRLILWGTVEVKIAAGPSRTSHILTKGDIVGDNLTLKALPEGTTIATKEDGCEFLCLQRTDYETLVRGLDEDELDRRVQFLSELVVPLFASWSPDQLRTLAKRLFVRKYTSRQVIVREGEPGSELFFIAKGECRVVREIELTTKGAAHSLKKTVKLLELAVLHVGEYFGELAPKAIQVDTNGKHRLENEKDAGEQQESPSAKPSGKPPDAEGHRAVSKMKQTLSRGKNDTQKGDTADSTDSDSDEEFPAADDINTYNLPTEPGVRQATVFSHTPVELLVLFLEPFQKLVVGNPLQRMREYAKGYPTAAEIRHQYAQQLEWSAFKMGLVNDIINC
ncbi:hypothetical protein DIPPA_21680 [Diplonema papillatum]|nr:hypothetical protein DIPPA_21680 [Diplonema papillatum]